MMIDLNTYLNRTVEIKIGDEIIPVKLPSCTIMANISKIEDTNEEKDTALYYKNRQKVAQVILNFNTVNRIFNDEEMNVIPAQAIDHIIRTVMDERVEAALDPNSDSQSQEEKSAMPS